MSDLGPQEPLEEVAIRYVIAVAIDNDDRVARSTHEEMFSRCGNHYQVYVDEAVDALRLMGVLPPAARLPHAL